jgi:thymidylate kinase
MPLLDGLVADPIPRPPDDWLLWILLLRALVDKGGLAHRHRPAVRSLASKATGPPPELEPALAARGLDAELLGRLAAAGEWDELERHVVARVGPAGRRKPTAGVLRRLRRLRGARGLSVAVLGPDGAGKTTLVEALDHGLPFETRRRYMGLTGGWIRRAGALRVPGLVLGARLLVLWGRYLRIESDRRLGRIVLVDRYVLDGAVPSGVQLRSLARLSRQVQRRACPLPDLVLLLDASGETMHGRKGEYDAETLEGWRTAYARLAGRVPGLEVLDAEQPAEVVERQAKALIWQRYRRRLEGREG